MIIEGRLSLPHQVADGQVVIVGDRIAEVITDRNRYRPPDLTLPTDHLLSPGFIDGQINGGFGKEFKTDVDAVECVTRQVPRFGVTSVVPTVTTKRLDSYREHLQSMMEAYPGPGTHARVLGVHLEGPALNAKKRGAHPEEWLLAPKDVARSLDSLLSPWVRMMTIAPELPGGWELASALIQRGVLVGLGHSLASYDEVVEHVDPGAMHIVHTFNGMADFAGRAPGLAGVALDRVDICASVIADLVHVHPASLRALWKARGGGQSLFGVSDGSAVLGLPQGVHPIGTREIEHLGDRAVLRGTDTLVGSVLTMNIAAKNIANATGCEIWEAINFVSLNTARRLHVDEQLGSIEAGKAADLCEIDDGFSVCRTIIGGHTAYVA